MWYATGQIIPNISKGPHKRVACFAQLDQLKLIFLGFGSARNASVKPRMGSAGAAWMDSNIDIVVSWCYVDGQCQRRVAGRSLDASARAVGQS